MPGGLTRLVGMSFTIALTRAQGVAPGDQTAGIDRPVVGRMGPSTDLFAPGGHPGRGVPAGPRPDFDSGALFAWGDTGDRDRD